MGGQTQTLFKVGALLNGGSGIKTTAEGGTVGRQHGLGAHRYVRLERLPRDAGTVPDSWLADRALHAAGRREGWAVGRSFECLIIVGGAGEGQF